ncbi:trypsin-3-like [Ischnura elegans]|uniref:trypsin-3-like n=1 Tax=Ischnura elegans TaxID=197161 RepID=UPI001ED876C8|nr:trypsin-3-like [Ischnura elegans]
MTAVLSLKRLFYLVARSRSAGFRVLNGRPPLDRRIVGGEDAAPGEFPYQVRNEIKGTPRIKTWGGVANHALLENRRISHLWCIHLERRLGRDCRTLPSLVSTPFVFSCTVSPIALPAEGEELDAGTMVVISGWGYLSEEGPNAKFLQKVTVPVYDQNECVLAYKTSNGITDQMFCAGVKEGGKDACQRDSGGPVVTDDKLYGIVSWGLGCGGRGYPGVYAKVSSMKAFIAKETGLMK